MEMSEKGIHRLVILFQLMAIFGHVHHLFGVDIVEVGHEEHQGEEDGVGAGLLGLVDHAGGVQDFLVRGEITQPPERELVLGIQRLFF